MITGIQIKGNIAYIGKDIVYISNFEEMTVDTDKNNKIITSDELEEIMPDLKK